MLKKVKIYSLLAAMVASTAIGLFSAPSAFSQNNEEDETDYYGYESLQLKTQTQGKIYSIVLEGCLVGEDNISDQIIYKENISSSPSKWLYGGNNTRAGYIVDPKQSPNGKISCINEDDTIVSGYKSYIEYSHPTDINSSFENHAFACHLGFRPVDNSGDWIDIDSDSIKECAEASANSDTVGYMLNTDKLPTFPELSFEDMYLASRYTYIKVCTVRPIGFVDELSGVDAGPYDYPTEDIAIVYDDPPRTRMVRYQLISNPEDKDVSAYPRGDNEDFYCADGNTENGLHRIINNFAPNYETWLGSDDRPDDDVDNKDESLIEDSSSNSTCKIDGIGWLVCPVVGFMADIVDSTYEILDSTLLRTEPLIIGGTNNGLYESWKMMRNLANIAFVIAFLVIIFSQVTSLGVSNYGIKRLLPKLVVSAILVNLSYFICAVAVDLSNILGSSLKEFIQDSSKIGDITPGRWGDSNKFTWATLALAALTGVGLTGGWLAVLGVFIPALFAALGAIITVVVVLVLRQVLVILLVVLAPLAFVALLLPNTESYFSRWRGTFMTMLLLYPIIAVIFGASALASQIIMASSEQTLVQLMGALASVIPLAITPVVMQFAGGVLNRFAGIVNDRERGPIDSLRNRSMKGIERMQKNQASKAFEDAAAGKRSTRAGRFLSGRSKIYRDANTRRDDVDRDRELALQEAGYNASQVLNNTDISGASDRQIRAIATAVSQRDELQEKELKAAITVLEDIGMDGGSRQELATKGATEYKGTAYSGDALQKAAAIMQFSTGGMAQKMEILEATGKDGESEVLKESRARILQEAIRTGMPKEAPQYASTNLDLLSQGDYNHDRDAVKNIIGGKFTSEAIASTHSHAFKRAVNAAMTAKDENGNPDPRAMEILKESVKGLEANKNLFNKVQGDTDMMATIDKVKAWKATPPATTQQGQTTQQPPQPATVAPTSTSSQPDSLGGRSRDWSGYSQPTGTSEPSQVESPTFTPGKSSAAPANLSGGRSRDWSGYSQPTGTSEPSQVESPTFTADQIAEVADAMKGAVRDGMKDGTEKMSTQLKNTASKMGEFSNSVDTATETMEDATGKVAKELKNTTGQISDELTQVESNIFRPGSDNSSE